MKKLGVILIIIGIGIIGFTLYDRTAPAEDATTETIEDRMMKQIPSEDEGAEDVDERAALEMTEKTYTHRGDLFDVTGSKIIYGIDTRGGSSGEVRAVFEDGTYGLIATFMDLPDPKPLFFYEGWIVRRGADLNVISTGKVEKEESGYVNLYTSGTDLTDHDFYVLTIEPDDGNPAPDRHILEGVLKPTG